MMTNARCTCVTPITFPPEPVDVSLAEHCLILLEDNALQGAPLKGGRRQIDDGRYDTGASVDYSRVNPENVVDVLWIILGLK